MGQFDIIQFPYRTKDGVLEPDICIVPLTRKFISVQGVLTRTIYDPVKIRPLKMTGFFIQYKGVEYGSLDINAADLLNETPCNTGRIHSSQFSSIFN